MNDQFERIALANIRTLLEEAEKAVKPSGARLTSLVRKDGIVMELTASDDFGVTFTGGRHFGWREISAMQPPAIAEAMRWAINELYRKVHATTE